MSKYHIINLDVVDSTNNYAKNIALNSADHPALPIIIVANNQTNGRGRYERNWVSQEGNLFCSFLLEINREQKYFSELSFVASLALYDAIGDGDLSLKWPNDVLIGGKKTAGILLEMANDSRLVIGIGVNINSHPDGVISPATCLKESGLEISRDNLVKNLIENFDRYYQQWLENGFAGIREKWLSKCRHIGQEISVKTLKNEISGVFTGISDEGELLVMVESDVEIRISTGDVFFKS